MPGISLKRPSRLSAIDLGEERPEPETVKPQADNSPEDAEYMEETDFLIR